MRFHKKYLCDRTFDTNQSLRLAICKNHRYGKFGLRREIVQALAGSFHLLCPSLLGIKGQNRKYKKIWLDKIEKTEMSLTSVLMY